MDKETKFINIKAVVKSEDSESRKITAIGSNSKVDRDSEIVNIAGMDLKAFKSNPVLLWSHRHSELPIGRATKVSKTKQGELKFELEFASAQDYPFADTVFRLYKSGFLNSFSIGFMPNFKHTEYDEKKGILTFNKSELLEISAVNIPANSDARVINRSFLNEAVKASVIDEVEAKDFEITLLEEFGIKLDENTEQKSEEDSIEDEVQDAIDKSQDKVEETKVEVLIKRIEELENRVKELEGSDDIVEEDSDDSFYDELFKSASDDKSQEEDSMDEFLGKLLED